MNAFKPRLTRRAAAGLLALGVFTSCDLSAGPDEADPQFKVSLAQTGEGMGSVEFSPPPVDGLPGMRYPAGTRVTMTAIAGNGSTFTGWKGDCTGTFNPCTFTMDADKVVTATFQPHFLLALRREGAGQGSLSEVPASTTHVLGSVVTITAHPAQGSIFTGWTGDCAQSGNPCTLTITKHSEVTGVFAPGEGIARFDGYYRGTWGGTQSDGTSRTGPMGLTITNGIVAGSLEPISGTDRRFSGTVSSTGAITATVPAGSANGCSVALSGQISTSFSDGISRASAEGSYTLQATSVCNPGAGIWILHRGISGGKF